MCDGDAHLIDDNILGNAVRYCFIGGGELKPWNVIQYVRRMLFEPPKPASKARFVDLAPTANADNAEIYFEALDYATSNDNVLNIALTGPYGSGKSSVIKSYLARYPGRPLQLSLASFLPEGDKTGVRVTKQEIERSILQQILYGVEADKLPFSRFKRIQTPKRFSVLWSLLITAAFVCGWYIFGNQTEILSGSFFIPWESSKWFRYVCVGVVAAFCWKAIHTIYTTSFGLSLKGISLKDVQIAPAANEESILNRHLDEILYFFQSTDYDLVIIEDLDRFDNPDIFVTLREINGLINANEGIKRPVRFLYALRDDIFGNTDRTKFFEFIVPIIPIINHSNSIDKFWEQGTRVELDARLNKQFVREVSRYLTDLRLIRNIFNEYVVYSGNLKADSEGLLDPNKLLAVLIYKNVIPKDFADLHRQEGVLSQILGRYDQYISKIETDIRAQRTQIESNLVKGDVQFLRDETELRRVYAMALLEQLPANVTSLFIGDGQIPLGQLPESPLLEVALTQKSIKYRDHNGYTRDATISPVEFAVDPTRSFSDRKAEIILKAAEFKETSGQRLRELKAELALLRTRRFNEVVRESAALIEQIFMEVGDNRELLKYLILEGYLDDTYYQYISLFHKGRLSPNDNSFLIQIRGYNNPSPDFQLDNIAEVIASMRDEDFGHHYVLNRYIVDHLLSEFVGNRQRISRAVSFIGRHFSDCSEFFRSYYAKGKQVKKLIQSLAVQLPDFAAVALAETDSVSHAARILAYMPDDILMRSGNSAELQSFLSDRTSQVLMEGIDFDYDRLRSLSVEIDQISDLTGFPDAVAFVAENGLYRISLANIGYIVAHILNWQKTENLEKRHFSTLKEINDPKLLKRIYADFQVYVRDVLLKQERNTDEDLAALLEVLNCDDVEFELRVAFLKMQTAVLSNFDGLPTAFHPMVLEGKQIEFSWENSFQFMRSDAYDQDLLTAYLQDMETATTLSLLPIPSDDAFIDLRRFIVGNNALDIQTYQMYVRQLPRYFNYVPDVDADRIKILIAEHKISFTPKIFEDLPSNLKILYVAANFAAYVAKKDEYIIDDEFRSKLLQTGISDIQKLQLINDMAPSYVVGAPSVAATIGPILEKSPIEPSVYGSDFVKTVIQNSRGIKIQISLFNKLHVVLSVSEVREVLRGLSGPYHDIAIFGRSPKIENSDVNRQLASWLKERRIISSVSSTLLGEIRIHTFKKGT